MQKWEYVARAAGGHDENSMGSDGWELVAVANGLMFYKRPLVEAPPEPVAEPEAPPVDVAPEPEPMSMPDPAPEPQGFGVEPAEASDAVASV